MAPTTAWNDCVRFAAAVRSVGGTGPAPLEGLLSSHEVLSAPARTEAPETAIMTAALRGELTPEKLTKLAGPAAAAANARAFLAELARNCENSLLGQWHREMKKVADEVLDSIRPAFDRHAAEIERTRELISVDSTAEQIIQTGRPELVTAWQELSGHIKVIAQIARIATQFGPRGGIFPQITEYALGENFRLVDAAICCTDGDIEHDSVAFNRPDPMGHRDSPWFKVPLRLHSI